MTKFQHSGHQHHSSKYDKEYNKNVAWSEIFDKIVFDFVKNAEEINFSHHIRSYQKTGNRGFSLKEITIENILNGEIIEIENKTAHYKGKEAELIEKVLVRLPVRKDNSQICVVMILNSDNTIFVITAWLNDVSETHTGNLSKYNFEKNPVGKYGCINGEGKSKRTRSFGYELLADGRIIKLEKDKFYKK